MGTQEKINKLLTAQQALAEVKAETEPGFIEWRYLANAMREVTNTIEMLESRERELAGHISAVKP